MTTTIFPRPDGPLTLPGLELEETPDRVSPQAAQQTQSTTNGTLGKAIQPSYQKPGAQHRVLSSDEWIQFCRGVGVMGDDESTKIIRPTCWYWPPKGFPDGLYHDVLWEKAKFTYWFHILASIRWTLMILQLALNAVLTALGSLSFKDGTSITVVAGINTLFAGILALMHNSGLPDRYRSNRNEFSKVEEYLKEIIDTRLVLAEDSIIEVLSACFDKFANAKQTVQNNVPASYISATPNVPSKVVVSKSEVGEKN